MTIMEFGERGKGKVERGKRRGGYPRILLLYAIPMGYSQQSIDRSINQDLSLSSDGNSSISVWNSLLTTTATATTAATVAAVTTILKCIEHPSNRAVSSERSMGGRRSERLPGGG